MTDATEKDLEKLTVKELREMAKEIPDATGLSSMKKDELIALLKGAPGATSAPAASETKKAASPQKAKKPGKKLSTIKDFKDAIASLREEKQQSASKKEAGTIRRRMNRLRKRTRKAARAAAPASPVAPPTE